jgi:hypothetical protein
LVEQYDRETVPTERLVAISADGKLEPLAWLSEEEVKTQEPLPTWLTVPPRKGEDRVLLLIHGTFSKIAPSVTDLSAAFPSDNGESWFRWAARRYRAILGFDHWTLSKTPEQNAEGLWKLLPQDLRTRPQCLDIITHSRGGLVARSLIELLKHGEMVKRVVFVGTPNAGTNLANPEKWGTAADFLINLVHTDPTGIYGRLSGFLVQLGAADGLQYVPGLMAQNPAARGKNEFLGRLLAAAAPPSHVEYYAVSANYTPARDDFNLVALLSEAGNLAVDSLFGQPNDLVVDTAHVWSIAVDSQIGEKSKVILPARILLFNTDRQQKSLALAGITTKEVAGIHHVNFFRQGDVREFLRRVLSN